MELLPEDEGDEDPRRRLKKKKIQEEEDTRRRFKKKKKNIQEEEHSSRRREGKKKHSRAEGRKARVVALQSRDKAPTSPLGVMELRNKSGAGSGAPWQPLKKVAPAACLRFLSAPSSSSCHLETRTHSGRRRRMIPPWSLGCQRPCVPV